MKKIINFVICLSLCSIFILLVSCDSGNYVLEDLIKPQSINIITNTRISKKNSSLNIEYEILPKEYSYNNNESNTVEDSTSDKSAE